MSLFGAQAAASQSSVFGTPQSAPSLFGSQSGGQASSQPSGFGAPQSAPSLFGSQPASTSVFGAPASSSSLFGAPPASSSSVFDAPASSASLFESSASLFGGSASSSSLFGSAASSASLFGASASSASLFGAPQQQQQQPQQVQITGRTRISELPQNFQTDLLAVERHLREQRGKSAILSSKRSDVDQSVSQTKTRSVDISKRLVKLKADLESLQTNADVLKTAVKTERGSAEPILVALQSITKESRSGFIDSNGLRYGITGSSLLRAAHVPEEYFTRVVQEMEARAHEYKIEIEEIAEFLKSQGIVLGSTVREPTNIGGGVSRFGSMPGVRDSMDISTPGSTAEIKGRTIEEVIRRQYDYFMVVASSIATLNDTLRTTKDWFLRILKTRKPDEPDPFSQASLREKAEKDRQLMLAERSRLGQTVGLGNSAVPTVSSQPSLFQSQVMPTTSSQPSLFQSQAATGGFGISSGGFGQNTGFASNTNSALGSSSVGAGVFGGTINTSNTLGNSPVGANVFGNTINTGSTLGNRSVGAGIFGSTGNANNPLASIMSEGEVFGGTIEPEDDAGNNSGKRMAPGRRRLS